MNKDKEEQLEAFNRLFITNRSRYIMQNKDGTYVNSSVLPNSKLTDSVIRDHLSFKKTIGIFSLDKFTKHITFDIDAENYSEYERQQIVLRIVREIENCHIPKNFVHTSISGAKGFHCTIHFDDLVYLNKAYDFYEYIISECGFSNTLVEFRPLPTIGQKLTLGIHKKTGIWCQYVDIENNFNKIYDPRYIINIIPYDRNLFEEIVDDIKVDEVKLDKIRVIANQLSPNKFKILSSEDAENIEKYGMIEDGTRNFCSVQLAIYYNTLGLERSEAIIRLNDWISNQSKEKFKTNLNRCFSENVKIINWVYNNHIIKKTKFEVPPHIDIFKREIDVIKKLPDIKQREVLFCLLIHSKIYGDKNGEFSMSYDQINKNRNVCNDRYVSKCLKQFSSDGLIKYTSNMKERKSNKYKVLFLFEGIRKVNKLITINESEYGLLYNLYFDVLS